MALSVMFSTPAVLSPATTALAQTPVDLSDLALTLADLPEGFELDSELTREEPLADIGVTYTVAAKAEPSEERLASGPVRVWQQIIRLDQGVVPREFFAEARERIMANQNLSLFPGAVDSPNNVLLIEQVEVEGEERVVYGVARMRDNVIWFTLVGGSPSGTTIQSAITLNNLSLDRYDRFRVTRGWVALLDALFVTPFTSSELPPGFNHGNLINVQAISDRALAHNGVGEIDLEVMGPGAENRITFIVYASAPHARWSFDDAPQVAEERGSVIVRPDGYDYPVLCVMRAGERDGNSFGATSCLGLVRNVEVSAYSLVADEEFGNMDDALKLMEAGVMHLNKVTEALEQPR
jgi:hypothetical protein